MLRVPVIAVIGTGRKAGKTTVAAVLVSELVKSGLRVAAAKHISEESFTLDASGKDTRRLAEVGAQQVVAVTGAEVVNILKTDTSGLSLEALVAMFKPVDLVILEGFKGLVLEREDVVKVVVSSGVDEILGLLDMTQRPIAAITGGAVDREDPRLKETGIPMVHLPEEAGRLVALALEHYKAQRALIEILAALGGLDCGDCGYETCYEHAKAILAGKSSLDKCVVVHAGEEVTATIDGVTLPMKGFVQGIIRKAVLGMMSSLHKTDIHGDERLDIVIKRPEPHSLTNRQ